MEKKVFEFNEIKQKGYFDNAGRWYPTDPILEQYCSNYRQPSRAWPYSLLKACLTQKAYRYYQSIVNNKEA